MRNQLINLLDRIFAHPKTTIAGLLVIGLVGLYINKTIDNEKLIEILGVLGGAGLIGLKDPKKEA